MRRLSLEFLPITLILTYLFISIFFFYYGPFSWPINNGDILFLFLAFTSLALIVGYTFGLMGSDRKQEPLRSWKTIFIIGGISACGIVFPSAYIYTGHMPWEIFQALADQRATYENMLQRLVETEGQRGPIAIARALTYPFVFAVIPLGVLHWKSLNWILRGLLFLSILSSIAFSILRGTDRETADVLFVAGAALMVLVGRYCHEHRLGLWQLIGRRTTLTWLCIGLVAVTVAAVLFVDRKAARLDDVTSEVCIGVDQICAEMDNTGPENKVSRSQFGSAMLTSYLSQGYYGLALGLNMDFQSTFGVGHSPLAARIYAAITGDEQYYWRTYTYRLRDVGWSDEAQYSTLFIWIANDIGFPMTVIFMGFVAAMFAAAWKDAVFNGDDRAAVLFCLLMQGMIYVPANNQIMQTMDAYFALISWSALWIFARWRSRASPRLAFGSIRHP